MGAEITFEYLAAALESTRGTSPANPTHYLPLKGMMTPNHEIYRPEESRGMLAEHYRAAMVREWAEWEGDGGADPNYAPFLFNMAVATNNSPTTPGGATNARLWTFAPAMTSDTIKTSTFWYGDPNLQIFEGAYGTLDELTIKADASSTDGATWTAKGMTQAVEKVSAPTLPAQSIGSLLMPQAMEVWIDTSSAIGTTPITGRVVSADFKLSNNLGYKYLAVGPSGSKTYQKIGRGKRHAETTLVFELEDTEQFDLWETAATCKIRVRISGDIIETTLRNYIQWDVYGTFDDLKWGDLESTNRTIELTAISQYDATAGYDFSLSCQNAKTTI